MIALYLLAAHMAGDFVMQTRWQAAGKFGWTRPAIALRFDHCAVYTFCFLPVVLWYGDGPLAWYAFPFALFALHFLTDSRRFNSTLGDVLAWRFSADDETKIAAHERPAPGLPHATIRPNTAAGLRLPASPWSPLPILIDQTLHLIQIAALTGLLLR